MIIFFIRSYNDIDHNTPIIYKLAQTSDEEIRVLSLDFVFPLKSDYRLRALEEKFGIKAEYIYKAFAPTRLHKIMAELLCGTLDQEPGEGRLHYLIRRFYGKYINPAIFYPILKRFVFSRGWVRALYREFKPSALVFDWIKMYQLITENLFNAAKDLKIPTIAVPPGIPMFTNDLHSYDLVSKGRPSHYGETYGHFDHFVVQFNHLKNIAARTGLPANKIHVLGSTRYCAEWQGIHEGLVSEINGDYKLGGEEELKVVYMDTLSVFRIKIQAVVDSLQRLSKLKGMQLLIKPHTRSNRLSTLELDGTARVVDKVPSGVLCNWADVIIGTSSSILLEAFRLNKVLLYPKFFHENTMVFEEFGACWQVDTFEEMEEALYKLMKNPAYRPYTDEQVHKLMTEVVCGGVEERDVLRDYADFILGIAHSN